jgi:parallel beta-helix repeat protein
VANICSSNGNFGDGAGIHATGSDNRIEGNKCTRADRGIDVDGTGSIIIKNTCSGNTTNYSIVANNRYGPIINITAGGTAAVSGNSAADTSGTTHPWANFAY